MLSPAHEAFSSFVAGLVQKCKSTITTLRKSRQIHCFILTATPFVPTTPFLNNNILSIYAKCGSHTDCCLLFDKMPHRNVVSYNTLIALSSRSQEHAVSSFELLRRLRTENLRPNGTTFTSLLQGSSFLDDFLVGSALHTQVMKFGYEGQNHVQTALLGMYCSFANLESAAEVFTSILDKDVVAWNSIIVGYMKNDRIERGLSLYERMVRSGTYPDECTYSMIFKACSRQKDHRFGKLIHGRLIKSGVPIDLPLQNVLVDMYFSCGDTLTAFEVFSRIEEPCLVSWNSMVTGCAENGLGEEAMEMFVQLQRHPSIKPDDYTFAAVISATKAFPSCSYGKPLHAQVMKTGCGSSIYVGSSLITMYFNNAEADSAQKIFNSVLKKDAVLWTEMITGYSKMADGESAIKFFQGMQQEGKKIDSFSLSSVLSACAVLATVKQGEMFHCQAIKTGYFVEVSVHGSLVDMYSKSGNIQAAESVLSLVEYPDLKSWNAMLGGYGHFGMAEEAMKAFDEILKTNLRPDQVTFISLLAACSNSGLVDKGKFLWNYMKENGFRRGFKHFSCMVSLLSRAGLLKEAEEMIYESPFSVNHLDLWRTLLSSCIPHGNLELGIRAAEEVFSIDADDVATHTLLANLYAAAGKWDDVTRIRKTMRGLVLFKEPGRSWIEVMNDVHVFFSGDESHPKIHELQAELHKLQGNMKISKQVKTCRFKVSQEVLHTGMKC